MDVTLEQVERLREKADVSYTDAKTALEQSEGDLLGALIWLEQRGRLKTDKGGFYSTDGAAPPPPPPPGAGEPPPPRKERPSLSELLRRAWAVLTENELEIWRRGKMLSSVPLIILLILLVIGFWVVIPVLVAGLFLGCRYTFNGPDLGREEVNGLMDSVSQAADQIKTEFRKHTK